VSHSFFPLPCFIHLTFLYYSCQHIYNDSNEGVNLNDTHRNLWGGYLSIAKDEDERKKFTNWIKKRVTEECPNLSPIVSLNEEQQQVAQKIGDKACKSVFVMFVGATDFEVAHQSRGKFAVDGSMDPIPESKDTLHRGTMICIDNTCF
jgi:hypothetical protein